MWLCALAFAARLATLLFAPPMEFDVAFYRGVASRLLAGDGYSTDGGRPETYWMPLAVALHVVAQSIHPSPLVARALWALLGVAGVAIGFLLARQLFGQRVGLLFAALMAVYPYNLIYGMSASTEIPNVLLLMLTAWLVARGSPPVVTGLIYGAACLCRAPNLALLPLLAWWVWRSRSCSCDAPRSCCSSSSTTASCAKRVATFLAGFLLVAAPWSARNSMAEHTFVPLSAGGMRNAWLGTNPWCRAWIRGEISNEEYGTQVYAVCDPTTTPYAEQQRRFAGALRQFATEQPAEFATTLAFKTVRFWGPAASMSRVKGSPFLARQGRAGYLFAAAVGWLYLAVLAAAVAAVVFALWRGRLREIGPVLLWMAFGCAVNIWFDAPVRARYTSGTEMCLLLLAAWLAGAVWKRKETVSACTPDACCPCSLR